MKKRLFRLLSPALKKAIRRKYYFKKFSSAQISDEKDLPLLSQWLKPGHIALDIGANYGLYTRFMAECVGPEGRLYSFEPVPEVFDVLQHNIKTAGLKQAQAFPYAVSEKNGRASIHIPHWTDGSDNYYEASLSPSPNQPKFRVINIETLRLDHFCRGFKDLHFIKMDVEGHEPQALNGATEILKKFRPILLIEINDDFSPGSTGSQVKNMLEKENYRMFVTDGNNLKAVHEKAEGVNYWFIPMEKIEP